MDAQLLGTFLGGAFLGAFVLGLAVYTRLRWPARPDSRVTFHRPKPHMLVVEVRANISAAYAEQIRTWFEAEEPETRVLIVCLE